MKKFIVVVMLLMTTFLFSQEIKIKNVEGKVVYEVSKNQFKEVDINTKLNLDSFVDVSLNSSLVLMIDNKIYSINSLKRGTIKELMKTSNSGIRMGSKATSSDVDVNESQKRTNISVASTRASDATKDFQWEE